MSDATYTVQLFLAELYWTSTSVCGTGGCVGVRVFNVSCNGQVKLPMVDIYAAVRSLFPPAKC